MIYRFVLLSAVLILTAFPLVTQAGVEPSPFQPEINQLGAVTNGLNSCFDRVQKVLAVPPDDILPSPNLNGAVNRLEAINGQVNSLNDFVANTISSVMGVEPTPFRTDLIPALEEVGNVSQGIVDTIGDFIAHPPEPGHPDFITALRSVESSALYLTDTVRLGIEALSSGECVAADYDEPTCIKTVNCEWITDPASGPYCCCTTVDMF